MPNSLVPTTDREIMFSLSNKIDVTNSNMERLCETIENVVRSLEKLEATKLKDHETRINKMELRWSELGGMYKTMIIISGALSVVATIISILKQPCQKTLY